MTRTISRKEVAAMLEVSVDVVRRNEKRFGLRRIQHNKRLIVYFRSDVQRYRHLSGLNQE